MRMLELCRHLDFAPETLAVDAGGEVWREHLDDDFPSERAVDSDEYAAHAPARELGLELVAGAERCLQLFSEVGHRGLTKIITQSFARSSPAF